MLDSTMLPKPNSKCCSRSCSKQALKEICLLVHASAANDSELGLSFWFYVVPKPRPHFLVQDLFRRFFSLFPIQLQHVPDLFFGKSVQVPIHHFLVGASNAGEAVILIVPAGQIVLGKEQSVHPRTDTAHVGYYSPAVLVFVCVFDENDVGPMRVSQLPERAAAAAAANSQYSFAPFQSAFPCHNKGVETA